MTNDNWRLDALCNNDEFDAEWWFPQPGQEYERRTALRICAECPVAKQCGDFASHAGIPYGIYGGRTAKQRSHDLGVTATARQSVGRIEQPCGTPAAYRRHHRKGQPACARCVAANSADIAERRAKRASA